MKIMKMKISEDADKEANGNYDKIIKFIIIIMIVIIIIIIIIITIINICFYH